MNSTMKNNLLLAFSVFFLLVTSAFTFVADNYDVNRSNSSTTTCYTCDGPIGDLECADDAQYCGFVECDPDDCDLHGSMCGEDCGGDSDPGEEG